MIASPLFLCYTTFNSNTNKVEFDQNLFYISEEFGAMLTKKTILVVEDNALNRAMLCEILSSDYRVLEAENGQAALEILSHHHKELSLILLDIMMPVMNGYTFLSVLKSTPDYASIPVIVTTQSDSEADEVTALSHGATDFVAKPYKPQIILHRVAGLINLRETAAMVNQFRYDRLTGLYSREFFYQRVGQMLEQNPGQTFCIVCSNIENFKLINDIFGAAAGDRLLQGIAAIYQEMTGNRGVCARLNADQFACLLPDKREFTDEMFIRVARAVNALPNAGNVVMKWGVYPIENRDLPVEQMCDRALLAARSIKGQYGKYFAYYDDHLRGVLLRQQAIIDEMEPALAQEQFLVYLQPKYRLQDHALAGAEALVRWNHPKWGFLSPAEFIPIFEKNGFITKMDQYIWDRTCAILREWKDNGYPDLPVSVNVSRADVYNADIADLLLRTVQKYDLSPSMLHLEITESAYTENPDQMVETVKTLRGLGFLIEMDDFGSGYSSLNMLSQMPIDVLKLDMKFIQDETAWTMDAGILHFIMDLARWMHLIVVAEGVETREQLDRLVETGCDYVQGYYFAKPMPVADFERLIQTQHIAAIDDAQRPRIPRNFLLVADEDAAYRQQVADEFHNHFVILEAQDETQALRHIAAHEKEMAAVLLSATLPRSKRLAVLMRLQKENATWGIPVIVTGQPQSQMEEQALSLGAADYAFKPHSLKSLALRLRLAIRLTSFQERERILQNEACKDPLTGIFNRRGWNESVESIEKDNSPYALFIFDLDNLKHINDTCGHLEGDRLIQEFGAILRAHTRQSDILARFGGDEFIVMMKRMTSGQAALNKGEEICRALQSMSFGDIQASVSVGVALSTGGEHIGEVIRRVDQALYQAKATCKGRCCLWAQPTCSVC